MRAVKSRLNWYSIAAINRAKSALFRMPEMITKLLRRILARPVTALRTGSRTDCPICDTSNAPVVFDNTREQWMLICRVCRHLFWECTPTQELLTRFYESEYCQSHHQSSIQEQIRPHYRIHLQDLLGVSGRPRAHTCLVDYGSSIPTLVHEARELGIGWPIAVDVDWKAWEYAHKHGLSIMTPMQFAQQLPDESVDIIRFSHILEHLIDPIEVLGLAVNKLRPGAILYITQPNYPVLRPRQCNRPLKDSVYPTHLHFFSPISLVKMVTRFPLDIERLFTVEKHDEAYAELADHIDLRYARRKLATHRLKGALPAGKRANYPYYAGENSALYARKRAA